MQYNIKFQFTRARSIILQFINIAKPCISDCQIRLSARPTVSLHTDLVLYYDSLGYDADGDGDDIDDDDVWWCWRWW